MTGTLLVGALVLTNLAMARTKSYDITIDPKTTVGGIALQPGDYALKVQGESAIFTNLQTSKKITVPAKIETAGSKNPHTAVELVSRDGGQEINAIKLGGSDETLEFGGQ
jgi:hypothetical protein